jgi:predicted amidophosphoribosyltransferase
MAMIRVEYCQKCQEETSHCNGRCGACWDREERQRIAAWRALTTDEKLDDLRERIEVLERGPARF